MNAEQVIKAFMDEEATGIDIDGKTLIKMVKSFPELICCEVSPLLVNADDGSWHGVAAILLANQATHDYEGISIFKFKINRAGNLEIQPFQDDFETKIAKYGNIPEKLKSHLRTNYSCIFK